MLAKIVRVAPGAILGITLAAGAAFARAADAAGSYEPPRTPRATFSFDADWRFFRGDAPGAERAGFDDAAWAPVSLPHTWNDTDTYRAFISHSHGDRSGAYRGIGWYRKRFRLPAAAQGDRVFLEFEGLRQAARFWLNGRFIGRYENGVTAFGLDLTRWVHFGARDNVLAVEVDNRLNYREAATGVPFEWNAGDFNPDFGGLNRDAWLHLTGPVYQTLPLYDGLGTTGVYVYATDFDLPARAADVRVESQVRNDTGQPAAAMLSAVVVDEAGRVCARLAGAEVNLAPGESRDLIAIGRLGCARWWQPDDPYLYRVYSIVSIAGRPVDACRITTGFRETAFRGGVGTGGVWLNGRFIWLTGYAQRSANDWPGLGSAYPDWMHAFDATLVRSSNANYVRWMHVAPQRPDVAACDRYGLVEVCPAGDKEGDPVLNRRLPPAVAARQWEQRLEVMRDTMISFRNDPSILFWEAGNSPVTPAHLREMIALRNQWDPRGGRAVGYRGSDNDALNAALTPIAEYYGVMIGQAPPTDALRSPTALFRAYSAQRRDRAPLIECEDFRDEAARGIWDDFSPPQFGFRPGPMDAYHWTSESFCLAGAARYEDYVGNRIDRCDPARSKWSAYASIYWSDSDADGRQQSSEVLRVSGKVDGVRLPKEMYFVSRVMQSPVPALHIIGHWTYPAGTRKTVYVAAAHCDAVELLVNGRSQGIQRSPCVFVDPQDPNPRTRDHGNTGFVYAFPNVAFEPGEISAAGLCSSAPVAADRIETAGPPARIRLTVHTGRDGLLANGSDVALIDFEVVDASGRRCPTDESRVSFRLQGPAIWRGGVNSGRLDSTNNPFLYTECGINRVAVRSTLIPGLVTLTATRSGLPPATVGFEARSIPFDHGLTGAASVSSSGPIESAP